jgi:predicted Zn-dependent protease
LSAAPQDLVERALALSGADGCVVIADAVSDANLRWANNTLTTNGVTRHDQLTVIAMAGSSVGVVSQSGVTADGVEELVRAAEDAARAAPAAEDAQPLVAGGVAGGPDAAGRAGSAGPATAGHWDGPPAETSIRAFGGLVSPLGEEFARADTTGQVLFGYAYHQMRTTYLASSAGVRLRHDQPTGYLELNAKSSDFSRSAWAGVATADFTDVDPTGLAGDLSRRLGWAERQIDLAPGRYETILPPSAVADLMIYMYWSAGARDANDGRTVFSRPGGGTRVGEQLAKTAVTLRSDPAAPALHCTPFVMAHESGGARSVFDNGLPLAPTAWIKDGVLASLVQTRHSAALTGLTTTPYIDNLIMDGPGGAPALDDLVAGSRRALLLTCLWYIREVDPQTLLLTGLTRDGVYLVEDGEVVGAVNNFRFNESPVDLLDRIIESGPSVRTLPREWSDYFTRAAMPTLRVDGFNMSSVSQAS